MIVLSLNNVDIDYTNYFDIRTTREMSSEYIHDKKLYFKSFYHAFEPDDRAETFAEKVRSYVYMSIIAEGLTAGSDFVFLDDVYKSETFTYIEECAVSAHNRWHEKRFEHIRICPPDKNDKGYIWVDNGHSSTSWKLGKDTQMCKFLWSGKIAKVKRPNFHQHDAERFIYLYDPIEVMSSQKCALMNLDD